MKNLITRTLRSLGVAAALLAPAAAVAGNVAGTVSFEGTAPKRTVVKMDADPKCAAIHGDKKVGSEEVLVSKEGKLANVFVYIKDAKGPFPPPSGPAEIDQKGCMYTPHVQGIRVDQVLNIKSSDATLHNIHCLAKTNPEFNFGQPQPGVKEKTFKKAELAVKFKCDVHPWMNAWIHVMDHPLFATSDRDGKFSIANVPDGEYTIVAWHEVFGTQEAKVKVAGGDAASDFTFKAK